jgi:hypothetical protein
MTTLPLLPGHNDCAQLTITGRIVGCAVRLSCVLQDEVLLLVNAHKISSDHAPVDYLHLPRNKDNQDVNMLSF